jgi:hypothetical protein
MESLKVVRGQVSAFQQRFESAGQRSILVWDFRLERKTEAGEPLPRVPIEMRGVTFDGSLAEGDFAEAHGAWHDGETLKVTRITNLTTGAIVRARGATGSGFAGVLRFVFGLVALGIIIFAALQVLSK